LPEDLEEIVAFDVEDSQPAVHYEWMAAAGDEVVCTYVECDRERIELRFIEQGGARALTMQVCGYGRTTAFEPLSPGSFPDCDGDVVGVVIQWHDGDSFISGPTSNPCTLHVTKTDVSVTGSFECGGLVGDEGLVRLSTGTFSCVAEL
jgi:hypothetical protein